MKGYFRRHGGGFFAADDDTYERFRRIKEGQCVEMQFTQKRNYEHHKKFFSLISTAWSYLTEDQEKLYGTIDGFRKTITIAAGFYEPLFDMEEARFFKTPKSIAFDKMSQDEFEDLYERVKDILFTHVLKNITPEEFLANLNDY